MKRKIAIILIIFVLLLTFFFDFSSHFTRVSAGKAEPVPYLMLKWGSGENEVGLSGPYENFWYFGPATFDVDKEGNIYIVDQLNKRILKINKKGEVLENVNIEQLLFGEDPINLLPVKLIVTDKCMFLKYHYRGGVPILHPGAYRISIIKDDSIKTLNGSELLEGPIDVLMNRLVNNKIVLTPSIPPEDEPEWKGPKAVVVDDEGRTQIVKELKNESFDGITPGVKLLFNRYKDTWLYENARIEVKDPETGRTMFLSQPLENGAPIDSLGIRFNSRKIVMLYQTTDSWNEEIKTVTTHIAIFNLHPKTEENYTMVIGEEDRENILPPPFYYKEDFVLGEDGYYYHILYMKDGLLFSRFEPEVSTTRYQYRFIKFTKSFGKN
jgi:hypothetical protein